MSKVVSLSVHKNTLDQRKRHQKTKELRQAVREMTACKDVAGYVLIVFDEAQATAVTYDAGKITPNNLPEFAKRKLLDAIVDARIV